MQFPSMRLPTILGLVLLLPPLLRSQPEGAGTMSPEGKYASHALPGKRETLAAMREVNSYQLAHPDPVSLAQPLHHIWMRVTWYTGVMAAWEAAGDSSYLEQSLAYG